MSCRLALAFVPLLLATMVGCASTADPAATTAEASMTAAGPAENADAPSPAYVTRIRQCELEPEAETCLNAIVIEALLSGRLQLAIGDDRLFFAGRLVAEHLRAPDAKVTTTKMWHEGTPPPATGAYIEDLPGYAITIIIASSDGMALRFTFTLAEDAIAENWVDAWLDLE